VRYLAANDWLEVCTVNGRLSLALVPGSSSGEDRRYVTPRPLPSSSAFGRPTGSSLCHARPARRKRLNRRRLVAAENRGDTHGVAAFVAHDDGLRRLLEVRPSSVVLEPCVFERPRPP
jgi:hypothetical protein